MAILAASKTQFGKLLKVNKKITSANAYARIRLRASRYAALNETAT
ncbi:hypothetical protein [Flavobacterium johnsoniae]|nr:hypothetical protein [Flavobacterium johnsoniae]WQG82531.1 hypothetical protein SR927_05315 [Flavobacterium johnsoniae UW101]